MNHDQVKGRLHEAKGAVKEGVGKAVGNPRLKSEGQVEKTGGKLQGALGDVKEKVKDQIDKL